MRQALILLAYLLGSIPFAYLAVRLAGKGDIRRQGSGNVGATNVLRTAGWKTALIVAVLDVAKGAAAVMLMSQATADPVWISGAGLAAVVGHCFPVWLGFSGGKGVATASGVFVLLAPGAAAVSAAVWCVSLLATRFVSLSSVLAAAGFPVALFFLSRPRPGVAALAVAAATVIIVRHTPNIRRLVRREEPRLGEKR
jgi:glycerol-3-phosphate acyltransferase PlsY